MATAEVIQQFLFEFLGTGIYTVEYKIHFSPYRAGGIWGSRIYDRSIVKAYTLPWLGRINAYKIIEETLNLKDVRIL